MKTLVAIAFVGVLAALAAAGFFMLRNGQRSTDDDASRNARMARALAVRVGVSIAIFALVLLGYALGWIQPTGLPAGR
ncbi:DUF2909 domain-containing protein [Roseateles sp.]|uniref:DUF2909 domain-containing protein n=1 Tax=Roseateles sp. TaxID=1971397 RepID=UPI003921CC3B